MNGINVLPKNKISKLALLKCINLFAILFLYFIFLIIKPFIILLLLLFPVASFITYVVYCTILEEYDLYDNKVKMKVSFINKKIKLISISKITRTSSKNIVINKFRRR